MIDDCCQGREPWPLFLFGAPGRGKTCAALCVADLCFSQYFTVPILAEQHNAAMVGKFECTVASGEVRRPQPSLFREWFLERPDLLILDEIGLRSTVTDAHYEVVKHAIDAREGRPFIAISNHPLGALAKIYDTRVYSRLGAGTVVEVGGEDRRVR